MRFDRWIFRRKKPTAPSGPWTPLALQPLLWLKADEVAGSNGDPVTAWNDSSGNGNHLSGTGGIGIVDGARCVTFNGTQYMSGAQAVANLTGELSLFIVAKADGGFCGSYNASSSTGVSFGDTPFDEGLMLLIDVEYFAGGWDSTHAWKWYGWVRGVDDVLYRNSSAFAAFSPRATLTPSGLPFFIAGANSFCIPCAIAEVIVIPRAVTAGERAQVQTWLEARWPLAAM